MKIKTATERPEGLIQGLFDVWESSVRATHHFLSEQDIASIVPFIKPALAEIPLLLYVTNADGTPLGFMGIDGDKIEMLFISPRCRGMGLGRTFVAHAVDTLQAMYVDVNEQNPQAVGFYRHLGFTALTRSDYDGQGRPFPLLHMRLEPRACVPCGYAIAPAKAEHIPLLNDIELAAAAIFPPGSIPERVLSERVPIPVLTEAMEKGRLLVALDVHSTPVGYALLQISDNAALLAQLDVHPDHGRKGLGTALVMRIMEQARLMGLADLYLTTFSHVPWNAPWYAKQGFAILKEEEQPEFIKKILWEEQKRGLEHRVAMCFSLRP